VDIEESDSFWVNKFETLLKCTRQIDSVPTFHLSSGKGKADYLFWIEQKLTFLKDIKKWLIVVPNVNGPIWANVVVDDFNNAIAELWNISETREFVIADKNLEQIVVTFNEEKNFEIHIKQWAMMKQK
jgi:hypothetical protein